MYKGYAIPIDFVLCSSRKKGHSSFEDRKILLDRFISYFGVHCINHLVADREFMGAKWLQYLQNQGVSFVQRLKETNTLMMNNRGGWSKIKDMAEDLKPGETKIFGKRRVIKSGKFEAHVTILRTESGDLVALAHAEDVQDPCLAY